VLAGLLAEPGGGGAQPVADGLRDVRGLAFQGERAVAELGGLLIGAGDVAAAGDAVVVAGGVLDFAAGYGRPCLGRSSGAAAVTRTRSSH